jgi:CBS domain-containing membrane protein
MTTSANKVMTPKLITVPTGTTIYDANEVMMKNRIRHLPVIDDDGDIAGILSQRDLHYMQDPHRILVEMLMASPVHFVPEDAPLRQVIFHMLEKKISCLLVSDQDNNAIGIVTTDDLLWYLASLLSQDSKEQKNIFDPSTKVAIGEVATQLSNMGI